jgi:acetyl esterase
VSCCWTMIEEELDWVPVVAAPVLGDRMTSSISASVDIPMWSRALAERSLALCLGDDATPRSAGVSTYAAPACAGSLFGLSSSHVSVCEFDPLGDEGITFARELVQAGVTTEQYPYPVTFHGSAQVGREASIGRRMRTEERAAIRRGLQVESITTVEGVTQGPSDRNG